MVPLPNQRVLAVAIATVVDLFGRLRLWRSQDHGQLPRQRPLDTPSVSSAISPFSPAPLPGCIPASPKGVEKIVALRSFFALVFSSSVGWTPHKLSISSTDLREAHRVAGELRKMQADGVITGPQDPEAHFCASLIHTFGGTYAGRIEMRD